MPGSAPTIEQVANKLEKLGVHDFTAFPLANCAQNPLDIVRSYVCRELHKISGVDEKIIFPALEVPIDNKNGDLIVPIPRLRVPPKEHENLAREWSSSFPSGDASRFIETASAFGKFLRFTFKPSMLRALVIPQILSQDTLYGENNVAKGKKVIVEFSSPNIAKPFHAGHLRSTIIGGYLANLNEKMGADVTRINYLGDWGKQFGLLAVGYARYGDKEKLLNDPINHMFDIYVRINKEKENEAEKDPEGFSATDQEAKEYFKRMEEGDKDAVELWRTLRELSIEKYKKTYKRLNIEYDVYSGESQVTLAEMNEAISTLEKQGATFEDRGALLVPLQTYSKKLGKCLIRKSDGTTLYLTRDLGEAKKRFEKFKFDKMIYVAAAQQDLHFQQFFKILEIMGNTWAKNLEHINFGMVKGMSTRKGTVVFLDTILEETKESMHEVMRKNEDKYAQIEDPETVADLIGLSAVMIQDMQSKRINDYAFDWKRMLSFEGDTGPYLQYAHSRLCSMERNSGLSPDEYANANLDLLTEPIAHQLTRVLSMYPDTLLMSYRNSEPSTVITYLFRLSHTVSSCYDILWVRNQDPEVAKARMALYASARIVLRNGLRLLGITPVERM
ncbi:arginine--tRNA ligase [Starmerella bacillaris]|uniref:arginine--tRNA ligase n=1 Tax=Starmerella bacillaris TaxID=1247836 RepID=A0AAV5RE67_STABA|nr:arginine--tRNA ligase [Starmerella bacillaris]